jgi:1-deoxy-D-xylulose-5-phosphate reductoisomerase
MNKGLELIEACRLFDIAPEQVQVVIHPQSVIHSMVEYLDGSVLAQMGNPDMRVPIAHALGWPERIESGVAPLDMFEIGRLDFEAPDHARFPCLHLAEQAIRAGGTAPTILNAANEIAVGAFLDRSIRFTDIAAVIDKTLVTMAPDRNTTLEAILAADADARRVAGRLVGAPGGRVRSRAP